MDNKSDEQFIVIQGAIESNMQVWWENNESHIKYQSNDKINHHINNVSDKYLEILAILEGFTKASGPYYSGPG